MRKIIFISCLITFITISPVQAETVNSRYDKMLEDIIYTFLSPLESKAIKVYFGEMYLSHFCKFVEVKSKPEQAYSYKITYQFVTYERAIMPPYHLFTLKVENNSRTEWIIKDVKVRKIAENEDYTKICRKPMIIQ
ncbi:hypothetical protein COJ46_03985 [Bacillus sp. AFS077874]|uniref:DUF3888 domain-containing protein n=1 Tax=Bacillus sp. AFS077874 TaxID=2033513 RepID=UPI000BF86E89|nr:DUF3888 domain-containing protein [Bacillus sp. AFS077874]PFM82975.1 hypothetical protein COJ46_03985 [Bacillus sp. AFS077874]